MIGDLLAPGMARLFTKAYCRSHVVDESRTETAVLLISELVTNAAVHGRGEVGLALSGGSDGPLHVEVGDDAEAGCAVREFSMDSEDGRGLAIVASCALRWGVRHEPVGKTVWFEL